MLYVLNIAAHAESARSAYEHAREALDKSFNDDLKDAFSFDGEGNASVLWHVFKEPRSCDDEYQEEGSGLRMILPALPAKPLSGGQSPPEP